MNSKYFIACLFFAALTVTGCKKFLQVQPEGAYTEEQVFSNEHAVQQALNGLYLSLADNTLYGATLSNTTIELMGQRYNTQIINVKNYYLFSGYQYGQAPVQAVFDSTWKKAYNTILSGNLFLTKIDKAINSKIISADAGNELKGEVYGLRAMLHFDLLRLFGPVYSLGADKAAIPYLTEPSGTTQAILPAKRVMDSVIADFTRAAGLLAKDPVVNTGIVANGDFYSGSRNQRMNYYAVKGLLARAYLWAGKKTEAHDAALSVLSQGEKWFPWLDFTGIVSNSNPDRIFSPELLFSIYNFAQYTNYATYFAPEISDPAILAAQPNRLMEVFENNENDYRYTTTWVTSTKTYRTFYKFADLTDKTKPWRFLQPLLRKTEMYYILAETETDISKARVYLNTVRKNRGLPDLAGTVTNLAPEILKEYKKEYWGEGQIFFYYKRNNTATVPSGTSKTANVRPSYVVPLPLSETLPR
jgi:hypothetical protein